METGLEAMPGVHERGKQLGSGEEAVTIRKKYPLAVASAGLGDRLHWG